MPTRTSYKQRIPAGTMMPRTSFVMPSERIRYSMNRSYTSSSYATRHTNAPIRIAGAFLLAGMLALSTMPDLAWATATNSSSRDTSTSTQVTSTTSSSPTQAQRSDSFTQTTSAQQTDEIDAALSDSSTAADATQTSSAQAADTAKAAENSWRYRDGVRLYTDGTTEKSLDTTETQSKSASSQSRPSNRPAGTQLSKWSLTSEGAVSPTGEVIEGATAIGIDVSHHQGTINWEKVKAAGIDFVILRCGQSTNINDRQWKRNVGECERLGIPYGVYLYSTATTVDEARDEAQRTLRDLAGHSPSYPVYFDLEESDLASTDNRQLLADMAQAYCDIIEDAGYTPGVYANVNWWNNYLTDSVFDQWDRWIAHYRNYQSSYKKAYHLWQCSDVERVDGIIGNVDLDFEFGGTPYPSKYTWIEDSHGWWLKRADGSYPASAWEKVNGTWYYFDSEGYLASGWQKLNGPWYYLNPDHDGTFGAMQTGWQKIDGIWYHFASWGGANVGWQQVDGTWYHFDLSGGMETGWLQLDGSWHYFAWWGGMRTDWQEIDNTWYYFDSEGILLSGWQKIDGSWYYLNPNHDGTFGAMQTGWQKIDGIWYYFVNWGGMVTGSYTIDAIEYLFDSSGAWQS